MLCEKYADWSFLFSKFEQAWLSSCCMKHECFLIDFCLSHLLSDVRKESSNAQVVHKCTNALSRLTNILKNNEHKIDENHEAELLCIVFQFIDFNLDVVSYSSIDILENLLHVHANQCGKCKAGEKTSCKWIYGIFQVLSDQRAFSSFKLRALTRIVRFVGVEKELLPDEFFVDLYGRIGNPTISNVISTLIVDDLCFSLTRRFFHIKQIKTSLVHECQKIRLAIKQRLLPAILKIAPLLTWFMENFIELLDLPQSSPYFLESELTLTKFAISHQKTISLSHGWEDFLAINVISAALLCDNDEIKLTAWSLLCDHPKKSRPFSAVELDLAMCLMSCCFAEQSPQLRQKIFCYFDKMLSRIRDSSTALFKRSCDEESEQRLKIYKEFLFYMKRLLFNYLSQESANFNRRFSALSVLKLLFCGNSLVSKDVDLRTRFKMISWIDNNDFESLLQCLDDEFQLCQEMSFDILTNLNDEAEIFNFSKFADETKQNLFVENYSNCSLNYRLRLLCTIFPHEIRMCLQQILCKCDDFLHKIGSGGSFLSLVDNSPHLFLTALENVLWALFQCKQNNCTFNEENDNVWIARIISRIFKICFKLAEIVSPVCHSLSPEGFLPPEFFDQLDGGNTDINALARIHINSAQNLLVCCWRTHKCISSIFSLIISRAVYPQQLTPNILLLVGNYFWLQLTECRHCGAFEFAAQAFETFCTRLWAIRQFNQCDVKIYEDTPSPADWLEKTMNAINGKNKAGNLVSTRRSAGLPYLVSVILATAKFEKRFLFLDDTLKQLFECRNFDFTTEIHCVNVLKAIYSNSTLAEGVLTYAETAFCVCFSGCSSTEWSVRNAHCQFFSALIQRVFGISKSAQRTLHVQNSAKMTSFNFFSRYPSIYPILVDHFKLIIADRKKHFYFCTFPILILLTHLHKSAVHLEMKFPLRKFVPSILALLYTSPILKLRELAAAALISITSSVELSHIFRLILSHLNSTEGQLAGNFLDGSLILVSFAHELNLLEQEGLLQLSQLILGKTFKSFNFFLPLRSDFILKEILTLIYEVGDEGLKKQVLEELCLLFERVYNKEMGAYNFCNWHSALRPIGALFAEFYSEFWTHISSQNLIEDAARSDKNDQYYLALCEIRYEAYRTFYSQNKQFDFEKERNVRLIFEDLYFDFKNCMSEQHLEFIIAILTRERKVMNYFGLVLLSEDVSRCENVCLSTDICLNLKYLKLTQLFPNGELELLREDSAFEFKDFIGNVLTQYEDDEKYRLAALKLIKELMENSVSFSFLLEEACIALKDESAEVRSYATSFLSRYLCPHCTMSDEEMIVNVSFNAEICWSFALERFPDLPHRFNSSENLQKGSEIFAVSSANIFAEDFGIFEFYKLKEHLRNMTITSNLDDLKNT